MLRPFQFKNNYLNRKGKGRSGATLWHTQDFDSTPGTVPYYERASGSQFLHQAASERPAVALTRASTKKWSPQATDSSTPSPLW